MGVIVDNIPQELRGLSQWVARVGKIPINPHTLYGAKAGDPQTWGTLEEALSCVGKRTQDGGICDGVGFELRPPYCGIDIDHCIDSDTWKISDEAVKIIETMDSYTEFSPSGSGVHILYKNDGDVHQEWKKKNTKLGIEMYHQGRYFTVTGDVHSDHRELRERTQAEREVYQTFWDSGKQPQIKPLNLEPKPCKRADDDIITLALNAKNGAEFARLWSGDTSAYNSDESSADLALCNILAFYCGGDPDAVDGLFRQSGLMRDKWDRPTGGSTYGKITVQKAIAGCREFYDPKAYKRKKRAEQAQKCDLPPLSAFTYEDIKRHSADDIGTAQLFTELTRGFLCYVHEENAFYIYNGTLWKKDVVKRHLSAGRLMMNFVEQARDLIPPPPAGSPKEWTEEEEAEEKINKVFRTHYRNLGSANGRDRVMKDVAKLTNKSRAAFDVQPYLLNCKNCTFNLETGKPQPHNADDLLAKCVGTDYDPAARNERFEQFIDEICESNQEAARALQAALGYTLIGATPEECLFLIYGKSTRNGKGTLFDFVLETLGDYGAQMDFDTIARSGTKDGSRATPDLARLVGTRFVLVNEPQKGKCLDEGLIKQLTGSDNITCRPLYGDPIEYKPRFKIYITTNNLPAVADDTIFASDRIRILPFNRHFSKDERDTSLKSKLREGNGKSALLNWLIEGYRIYRENGLRDTAEAAAVLRQYRRDNDYIQDFIDECLEILDPDDIHAHKERLTGIQREYNIWCKDSNIKPLGKKLFREELEKHGVVLFVSNHQYNARVQLKTYFEVDIK